MINFNQKVTTEDLQEWHRNIYPVEQFEPREMHGLITELYDMM